MVVKWLKLLKFVSAMYSIVYNTFLFSLLIVTQICLGTRIFSWSNEEVPFHISWKCSLIIRWRLNCGAENPTPCVLLYFKSEYCACSDPMSYYKRNYILVVFNKTKWYQIICFMHREMHPCIFSNWSDLLIKKKVLLIS